MSQGWREISRGVIHPWHHDQFGHMNVRWYAHFFDDAVFMLYPEFGMSLNRVEKEFGVHTVSARATTNFVKELSAGDVVRIEGGVSRLGGKSVSFALRMIHVDTGEVHATYDLVEVFFDPRTRQSAEMPAALREQLSAYLVDVD
jgi:acyl-CoA thioester hydrolase